MMTPLISIGRQFDAPPGVPMWEYGANPFYDYGKFVAQLACVECVMSSDKLAFTSSELKEFDVIAKKKLDFWVAADKPYEDFNLKCVMNAKFVNLCVKEVKGSIEVRYVDRPNKKGIRLHGIDFSAFHQRLNAALPEQKINPDYYPYLSTTPRESIASSPSSNKNNCASNAPANSGDLHETPSNDDLFADPYLLEQYQS